ncbi:MAG: hypothetical protein IKS30_00735 [Treponema sp.]|nr:hypothetical protein [Treponema sp.]
MKKLSVLILAAAALFAGCNNLTVEKNKDSKSGNVTINIGNQSRTISPMSGYSLSDFTTWKITFEDQNDLIDEFSVDGTKGNLTFTVPAGLYTVTVESSYNPPETADGAGTKLTLTGTRTDVEIGENTAVVNISVGLAKEKTGNFSYTLTGYVSGYVSLVNMNKDGKSYSAEIQSADIQSEETSEESALKAVYYDENSVLVVTGTGLKSGFYKLYVTDTPVVGVDNTGAVIYYDTDAVIYYDIGDFLVEIADGLTTTGSASSVSESQTQVVYYGTNDTETGYNGKFPFARKNVNDILQLLITNKKWQSAEIYMDTDVPNLDVVVINQLRDAMAKGDRSVSSDNYYSFKILGVSGSDLIGIYAYNDGEDDDSAGGLTSDLTVHSARALYLNAASADKNADVSKEFVINSFDGDSLLQNLILEDGVSVVTYSMGGITEKVQVELEDYSAYEKTPFLVFADLDEPVSGYIALDDETYVSAQKTTEFEGEEGETSYTISWYARVAYASGTSVTSTIPEFEITAEAENTTTNGDITTIPVAAGSTIKFSTSIEDPDETYTYAWYFTGYPQNLLGIDSVYEFDPTTADGFDSTDGAVNTIACVVSDGAGNWRSEVFQFVLTAAQSPIILYNNHTYDANFDSSVRQGLAAFDEIKTGQAIGNFLLEGAIADFCFDGNCNLYAVSVNEEEGTSTIYKYTYSLLNGYSPDKMDTLLETQSAINAISCDTTNGYLFTASGDQITVFVPGDQEYANYTLDVSVDEEVYNLFSKTDSVEYRYETAITNIAVSYPALYIAMDVIQRGGDQPETARIIARYTYEKSGESITLKWESYVAVGEFKVFEDVSEYPLTVNDMMVQDSNLYVLVSQQEGSTGSLRHRGALLTITDNNGDLSLTSTYGANTEYNYANDVLGADTFYAPQKFLAVMPKKLVIADEGYIISEYSKFFDEGEAEFVNRVVTVDLQDTSKSTDVNVNVSFDLYISIDGTLGAATCMNYQ